MARLDPLIRLRRHTVDEKRRALAELLRQAEVLAAHKDKILLTLARERVLADGVGDPTIIADYARFAMAAREDIAALEGEAARLESRLVMAQEEVRAAFAELKKVEITARERKKRTEKEQNAKESAELDAIGIENFRRQCAAEVAENAFSNPDQLNKITE